MSKFKLCNLLSPSDNGEVICCVNLHSLSSNNSPNVLRYLHSVLHILHKNHHSHSVSRVFLRHSVFTLGFYMICYNTLVNQRNTRKQSLKYYKLTICYSL